MGGGMGMGNTCKPMLFHKKKKKKETKETTKKKDIHQEDLRKAGKKL